MTNRKDQMKWSKELGVYLLPKNFDKTVEYLPVVDVDQQKIIDMAKEASEEFLEAYESEDFMDIDIPCRAANYVPQLLEIIEQQKKDNRELLASNVRLLDNLLDIGEKIYSGELLIK